jgi:hypothetical protein
MVREDGSEVTLKELRERYGETPKIRYYLDGRVHSDWVEVVVGEAVVVARLQKVEDGTIQWVDQSGLPLGQTDCLTHAQEDGESRTRKWRR